MPEDLKLSQIGSSQLPPPFRGLHSPGVRKHCQIIFACYFQKSSISRHWNNSHKEDQQRRFVDVAAKRDILTAVGEMVPLKVNIMMQHIHPDKSRSKQKRGNESNAMYKLATVCP